jgi:hypothetical protein
MNEQNRTSIVNALRVAALRYDEHVQTLATVDGGVHVRLAQQFERQAVEARNLATMIEDGREASL